MLNLASFVNDRKRRRFRIYEAFINARKGDTFFCAAPVDVGCAGDHPFVALYEEPWFHGAPYTTELRLPSIAPQALVTALDDALYLICFLVDQPQWLQAMERVDMGSEDAVLASFGLDPKAIVRPEVGAYEPGTYVAPHEGGYAAFMVEINGEVRIRSTSSTFYPVVLHAFSDVEAPRLQLTIRIAETKVP